MDNGVTGWGEALNVECAPAILQLAGHLVNQTVEQAAIRLLSICRRWTRLKFKRRVAKISAAGALDMALWDALGKNSRLPVADLLGTSRSKSVEVYASGLYYDAKSNLRDAADEAASYLTQGFGSIKMKSGGASIAADAHRIRSVRDAVGANIKLMADANGAYSLDTASKIGQVLSIGRFSWFEEPVRGVTPHKHAALRKSCGIAIAAGERWHVAKFETFLRKRAIDVVQPNIGNIGGFRRAKYVIRKAVKSHVQVALHSWGTPIALAAAVNLAAAMNGENTILVEFDCSSNPLRDVVQGKIVTPYNGVIRCPNFPGLGIVVDQSRLLHFCVAAARVP